MDSQWAQISVTKLGNSKITACYQFFVIFIKGSQWAQISVTKLENSKITAGYQFFVIFIKGSNKFKQWWKKKYKKANFYSHPYFISQ